MTVPVLKIKVLAVPKIKGKMDVRFPASVIATSPILLDKTGGIYTFSIDMNVLLAAFASQYEPIHTHIDQNITAGATATVLQNAETVRVNKTVGSPTTLTLPLASTMLFPFTIVDWKGDAGTNNITINPSGTEKIQGLSSWTIAGDNGSVSLKPIPGVGFAI